MAFWLLFRVRPGFPRIFQSPLYYKQEERISFLVCSIYGQILFYTIIWSEHYLIVIKLEFLTVENLILTIDFQTFQERLNKYGYEILLNGRRD